MQYPAGEVSSSTTVLFRYTVHTGDEDTDGISMATAISLNGATIKSATGFDAVLALENTGSTSGILIDAVAPDAPVITKVTGKKRPANKRHG